jgi:hypothetical protein
MWVALAVDVEVVDLIAVIPVHLEEGRGCRDAIGRYGSYPL